MTDDATATVTTRGTATATATLHGSAVATAEVYDGQFYLLLEDEGTLLLETDDHLVLEC